MKKLFLNICLFFCAAAAAWAQGAAVEPGSWKAYDLIKKADALKAQHSSETYEQAMANYAEAEIIIKDDITKNETEGKFNKLALLYFQNSQLQFKLLQDELNKAQQGIPFDTLMFCQRVDNVIECYNKSQENNVKPNAKGKVKENKNLSNLNEMGLRGVLTLYYNCGVFMDGMGNKQASVDYFQKFVDLPRSTSIFTKEDADSIYAKQEKIYSLARYNLALQNYALKNWDKAIENAKEALKDTIDVQNLYIVLRDCYGEKKDSVMWAQTLVEAAERTGNTNFYSQLVQYYMETKKTEEANQLIEKMVQEQPGKVSTWYIKGYIELDVKKDYAAARESFAKAFEINPDAKEVLRPMAMSYVNDILNQIYDKKFKYIGTNRQITARGRGAEVEKAYAKEKAIYDKELATVKGYYEKALPYLERLRELTPDKPSLWAADLQLVYSNLGMTEKAKEMDEVLYQYNQTLQGK